MHHQADEFAGFVERRFATGEQIATVPDNFGDHVDQQDPPGDSLARGQRGSQQDQDECPGEAGVRKVEQVVVDELGRDADQGPDER